MQKVQLSEAKNDPTRHLHLNHEEKCKDEDDIVGLYTVGDEVCSTTID